MPLRQRIGARHKNQSRMLHCRTAPPPHEPAHNFAAYRDDGRQLLMRLADESSSGTKIPLGENSHFMDDRQDCRSHC